MTTRFTERFGRFGKTLAKKKAAALPSSACPNCYAEGTLLPFAHGTKDLPFECACGTRWIQDAQLAAKHALWLDTQNRIMARNPRGD